MTPLPPSWRFSLPPMLCVLLALLPTHTDAAEWKGKRVVKDGVVHVMNSAEPMEPPAVYELRELWRLESETPEGELVFGMVDGVAEDEDGYLYLVDSQLKTVHVLSREGEYVRSIGREGEGPGELRYPTQVFLSSDGLVAVLDLSARRVAFFTQDGRPGAEWRANLEGSDHTWMGTIYPMPEGYAVRLGAEERDEGTITKLDLIGVFDKQGHLVERCIQRTATRDRSEPFLYQEEQDDSIRLLDVTKDGKVLVSQGYTEYIIRIFDPNGSLSMVVKRDYEPVARDETAILEERSYWESYFRRRKNVRVMVSNHERSVVNALPREDGSFWISTSRTWKDLPDGTAAIFDEFDIDGRFVRQITVKKQISPDDDLIYVLGWKVLIITGGYSSGIAAVGASSKNAELPDEGDYGIPTAIYCDMVRAQ